MPIRLLLEHDQFGRAVRISSRCLFECLGLFVEGVRLFFLVFADAQVPFDTLVHEHAQKLLLGDFFSGDGIAHFATKPGFRLLQDLIHSALNACVVKKCIAQSGFDVDTSCRTLGRFPVLP